VSGGAAPEAAGAAVSPSRWRAVLGAALGAAAFLALLFGSAGRLDWGRGWLFVALSLSGVLAAQQILARKNPDLLERRRRIGPGTQGWDRIWLRLYQPMPYLVMAVAGLDVGRLGWSSMSPWLAPVGAGLFLLALALGVRAMADNPHFEATVRLQHDVGPGSEPGHRVADTGLYRLVRHPGYAGMSLSFLAMPLLLGSWLAYLPVGLALVLVVVRTALEDRFLRRELAGYEAYAGRVRYRLVPGIWAF